MRLFVVLVLTIFIGADSVTAQGSLTVSDFQTFQITDNNEIFITTHFKRALDSLSAVDSAEPNPHDFFRVTEVDGTVFLEEDIQLVVDSINAILGTSSGDDTSGDDTSGVDTSGADTSGADTSGADTSDADTSGEFQSCGDNLTYNDYSYSTVEIGGYFGAQCWFAENLRTTQYADETSIQEVTDAIAWSGLNNGARCAHDNDPSNLDTYGYLYNWYAVDSEAGLCPTGWHVPTDEEFSTLTANLFPMDGTLPMYGTLLKSSSTDTPSWDGTNESGWSGLPGGNRNPLGYFYQAGQGGFWWSSSPAGPDAWARGLGSGNPDLGRGTDDRRFGFSVRCIQDAP